MITDDLRKFKKILIVGSPGAGKSTFAKQLAKILDMPLYSMDDMYWLPNWQRPKPEKWKNTLLDVCGKNKWIIEGNYLRDLALRLDFTEAILLLDLPVYVCLHRLIKRTAKRVLGCRDDLPLNIKNDVSYRPKLFIRIKFIMLVVTFRIFSLKKMELLFANKSLTILRFRSQTQVENWLYQISLNR